MTALGESHDYDLQLLDFKKEPIVRHNFESLSTYKEDNGLSLNTTLFYLDLNKRIKSSSTSSYNSLSKNETSIKLASPSTVSSSKINSVITKSTSNRVTRSSTADKPSSAKRTSSESSYCSSDSASSFTVQKKLVKKTNERIENEKNKSSNSNEDKNHPQATVSSEILKIKAIESNKTNTNNTVIKVEKLSEEPEYMATDDQNKNNNYSSYSNSNNYSSSYYRNNSYYNHNGKIIKITSKFRKLKLNFNFRQQRLQLKQLQLK